jgi:hypothetical protein
LPVVRPAAVIGLALPVADPGAPPSVEAHDAVNPVTALPLAAPGVKVMLSVPVAEVVEPEAKLTADGGAGDPTMTAGEGTDAGPMPRPFVAVIVHVYVLPVVSEFTVIGPDGPEPEPDTPPSADVHDAV